MFANQVAIRVGLLALVSVAACSNSAKSPAISGMGGSGVVRCSSDMQCKGGACLGGNCILRTPIPPTWAIEIRPPSSSQAPLTERTGLPASTDALSLTTDPNLDVRITFNSSSDTAMPSIAQVVLTVPSVIGGRPSLTFETGANSNVVTLAAPEGVLARTATVDLLPLSPADQQSPPFSFAIDTLAQNNSLTIPTNNVWLSGFLHDALDQVPARPFVARAFQQGRLVSNLSMITSGGAGSADGSFRLAIPAAVAGKPVTVEIWPQDAAPKDPWFVSNDWSLASLDMGVITLPAYQTPLTFAATVQGNAGESIDGAFVRASTQLTPQAGGTTRFSQDGLTGPTTVTAAGTLKLSLIPGTAKTDRTYDVAVVPPPGTPFAFACATWPITTGGSDSSPAPVPTITVQRRPLISGSVMNASGSFVGNVVVTASRTPETARICETTNAAATGPTVVSTTTNATGAFVLALDPGTYQLDYDPPEELGIPRFTEYNVAISSGQDTMRQVHLLPPALIDGQVSDADMKPISNAIVRIFEPRCDAGPTCKIAPILRGETQTDDSGRFRVVVAMPPMATN